MIIILNNKSNLFVDEFIKYQSKLSTIGSNHTIVLCPSLPYLSKFYLKNIELGSQNVSSYFEGAYTGEVAASQLKDLGVKYCIVGHSERRKYQKETNQEINRKIDMLLDNNIIPILCVGENDNERKAGMTTVKVINEIKECLRDIDDISKVIIAYEPIWAIGTGVTATSDQAQEMCKFIREEVRKLYNDKVADSIRIQYGGSVKPSNANEILNMEDIDGALVGGASLTDDFVAIVNY